MVDGGGEAACGDVQTSADSGKQIVRKKLVSDAKPAMFQPGMLQDLMNEVSVREGGWNDGEWVGQRRKRVVRGNGG